MGTNYETGHHKNVANFADLIAFVTNLGAAYNPSRNELSPASLLALQTSAADSLTQVNTALPTWQVAVNSREQTFEPLSKLTTRVLNALSVSSGVDNLVVADATTIARKIQGRRASPKKVDDSNPDKETEKSISASQMSFDSRIENFDKFVKFIEAQPTYKPNETDLNKTGLNSLLTDLREKNNSVINSYVSLSNRRIERDEILYNEKTGLLKIAADVKKYVKSVFGTDAPQYKQISKLKFTRPR